MAIDTQGLVWLGVALLFTGVFLLALSLFFHNKNHSAPGVLLLGPLPVSFAPFKNQEAVHKMWLAGLGLLLIYAVWLFARK